MNYSKLMCLLLLCLSVTALHADKIDKKGTLLNANCNPIGTKCKASAQTEISYTFIYNEPSAGSFSLRIPEQELLKNAALQKMLFNKTSVTLDEEMQIPAEVIKALHMPDSYSVSKGIYPIRYQNNYYQIIIKE